MKLYRFKLRAILLVYAGLCLYPSFSYAQGFLKADGKKIVNEKGKEILLRGIGLGGWMVQEGYMLGIDQEGQQYRIRERIDSLIGRQETDKFYAAWLNSHTTKKDIDALKAWGFNSVRLPMHFNLYTLPIEKEPEAGKDTWIEKGFAMTDSLLAWCKANQLYLILDLHAAPGGQGNDFNISDRNPALPSLWDSKENQRKTIALWRKLAERYVNEPWIGGYDIINEPNWGFEDRDNDKHGIQEQKNAPLKEMMVEITKAIREIDKKHIIIIEGNGWGNNYRGVLPPWDDNMVLSFHRYWGHNDQESVKGIIEKRDQYHIPVWLGETGENSNVWFTEAISLLERNDIGWCWWPLKKLGFNNPLQVPSNADYQQVLQYWNKKGAKPVRETALRGLKKLASDLGFEQNIQHKDVVDAMFRQVHSNMVVPFKQVKVMRGKTTVVHASDYDLGKNGYAYFDKDTADYHSSTNVVGVGNRGRVYRNDGVDLKEEPEKKKGFYITDIEDGEWLKYTVQVEKAGTYKIRLRVSASETPGKISVGIDGKNLVTGATVPVTGKGLTWKLIDLGSKRLSAGAHQLKIYADHGGFDFKSIEISTK